MKILICGGRVFSNERLLRKSLDDLLENCVLFSDVSVENITVIHGDARGADRMAGNWAEGRGVRVVKYPADWKRYGNSAGPIRNQKMLDDERPDLVVAFPGGSGTADMCERAKKADVRVIHIPPF